jgi:DNA-binding response OmpR family regulator
MTATTGATVNPTATIPTVVIAEDNGDIRALVRISATRAGLEVVAETEDGDAALAAIRRFVPNVAILDVAMPGMSGLEVCSRVRTESGLDGVQILLLSASVDAPTVAAGMDAGAASYLSKPFSPRELTAQLAVYAKETP